MGGDDQRNLILALVLSALVLFGWSMLSERIAPTANPPVTRIEAGKTKVVPNPAADPAADGPVAVRARGAVLSESPRVRIATPRLAGSINLKGARIDDLVLTTQRETIAKDSPPIRLLSPAGTKDAYFAAFGWSGQGVALPDADTLWTATGDVLAPGKPVTLRWDNGQGQLFQIVLNVDDNYMFSAVQSVANRGGAPVAIAHRALISRTGISKDVDSWTMHSGPIGSFGNGANYDIGYHHLNGEPSGTMARLFGNDAVPGPNYFDTRGGWLGFGDKYWLTAIVPDQATQVHAGFRAASRDVFLADFAAAPTLVAPGKSVAATSRLFAGAKEVSVLDRYEDKLAIPHFDRAIDWGWFVWFEKPIFYLLDWLFRAVGNFGVAIMLLTLVVRGLMFPVVQRQFKSMAAMRVLQPKMKALQERHKDDKPRLQQEMMKLYQTEKVNPLAGCLPILIQFPVFYALYKVLMLTIEMRHQPFVLWIKDLSAADPLTPLNLFGLLDFTPPHFIAIGVLPILLGISMYLQFKLNPQPMDDTQKQIFAIMPWALMFIMGGYAAGLVLYWTTSNVLTILQQKWLYSRTPGLQEAPAKP